MVYISFPRHILIGGGSVKKVGQLVKNLGYSRPLIVSDHFLTSNGTVAKVGASLDSIKFDMFSDTISDPTTESVSKLRDVLVAGKYDSIIAVGGGSPIDSAKAASMLAVHGGKIQDYKAPFQMDKPSIPIIAIPTTAGTGSEATKFTIVSDLETNEKMLCIGLSYLPTAAIVDYELSMSMPLRLTADTGIDALCHAMEAYVSKKRNTFSQGLALTSLSKISESLRRVCEDPNNHEAREKMMLASMEAGMAFNNASVTLIHGMSRPFGAWFHVPHGLSNAMLAPILTKFSIPGAYNLYADVSRSMGMCPAGVSDEEAADLLSKGLFDLCKDLNVPSLKEWGVDQVKFNKSIPKMAAAALASGSPGNNPIVPTQKQIESLYQEVWHSGQ